MGTEGASKLRKSVLLNVFDLSAVVQERALPAAPAAAAWCIQRGVEFVLPEAGVSWSLVAQSDFQHFDIPLK